MNRKLIIFFLLSAIALLFACRNQTARTSHLFRKIMYNDTTNFRGIYLGANIDYAYQREQPFQPDHKDKLGLSYTFVLDSTTIMMVDYYSDNLKTELPSNRIASIVANIILDDEVQAAKLYGELRSYLNEQCGVSNGIYGDLSWETSNKYTPSIEVRLGLDDNKKEITLNYIDIQPSQDSTLNGVAIDSFYQLVP